jgi:hypothetical protein
LHRIHQFATRTLCSIQLRRAREQRREYSGEGIDQVSGLYMSGEACATYCTASRATSIPVSGLS